MTPTQLREILKGRTPGKWKLEFSEPYEAAIEANGKRLPGLKLCLDDAPVPDFNQKVTANARSIVTLNNIADELLQVYEAAKKSLGLMCKNGKHGEICFDCALANKIAAFEKKLADMGEG